MADFDSVAKKINRSQVSCAEHWHNSLLPILKTCNLGVPHKHDWKNDLMKYIVSNKVSTINELDVYHVVKKLCPGQTIASIKKCVRDLGTARLAGRVPQKSDPLHEICLKRLNNPRTVANGANNYKSKLRLQRIEQVIEIYKFIIRNTR